MNKPLITALIPAYNEEECINELYLILIIMIMKY